MGCCSRRRARSSRASGPAAARAIESLAREAGVACRIVALRSLTLDVDTVADLAALRDALTGVAEHAAAPRTRAVLAAEDAAAAVALGARA